MSDKVDLQGASTCKGYCHAIFIQAVYKEKPVFY